MAKENTPTPRPNFTPVTNTLKVAGGAHRDPASVTLFPSGRFVCNATAAELLDALILANKMDLHNVGITYGADEEAELVAGYIVLPGTTGAMPINRGSETVSCHMGNVFKKHPKLRPAGERTVRVSLELGESPPYILFSLQTATVKMRHKATVSAQSSAEGTAGATKGKTRGKARGKTTMPPAESAAAAEDKAADAKATDAKAADAKKDPQ